MAYNWILLASEQNNDWPLNKQTKNILWVISNIFVIKKIDIPFKKSLHVSTKKPKYYPVVAQMVKNLFTVLEIQECNPLQYSWLEHPMDTGAWWATVYRAAKSWTWLTYWYFHFH